MAATLRQRKQRFSKKKGIESLPHFSSKGPKGKVIYRNPAAKPVPRPAAGKQKRQFSMENVQWISIGKKIVSGGYGSVHLARVKFRGKKPQAAVIKKFFKRKYANIENEKIRRLNQSKVPHPKMEFVSIGETDYIIMEPFIKKSRGRSRYSKFLKRKYDLIGSLDLRREKDIKAFKQVLAVVEELSMAGLRVRAMKDEEGNARIDAFNIIRLEKGGARVFVQDLDSVEAGHMGTRSAFNATAEAILKVAAQKKTAEQEIKRFLSENGLM
ncbi:MAG: hypothetical protein JW744_04295 [Candidatus Diapherotrites archaeon]|uniref:Protein kinase domain-containing protein n=1 Tax=Candidatus Iainarchaeum sp. TaxID=3101447 RepID=A0A938YXU2_9ARCH|nr:hypothetical protein [Candidatus Diapherotrites archaeon]